MTAAEPTLSPACPPQAHWFHAIVDDDLPRLQCLLSQLDGVPVEQTNLPLALSLAIHFDKPQAVAVLCKDPRLDPLSVSGNGFNRLQNAIAESRFDAAAALFDAIGRQDCQDSKGRNLLNLLTGRVSVSNLASAIPLAEHLIKHGVSLDIQDTDGQSARGFLELLKNIPKGEVFDALVGTALSSDQARLLENHSPMPAHSSPRKGL